MSLTPFSACPCGSKQRYGECCEHFHLGEATPPTPEALMRSRYCAFAMGLADYLLETWHPDTRPSSLGDLSDTEWMRLDILEHAQSGDSGRVRFRATFRERRRWAVLEEDSRFVYREARWVYQDGVPNVSRLKPGRNDPCPCGTGYKFKSCCGLV